MKLGTKRIKRVVIDQIQKVAKGNRIPLSAEEFRQQVEKKAYELFEKRGCIHGYALQDWQEAEKIVREQNN